MEQREKEVLQLIEQKKQFVRSHFMSSERKGYSFSPSKDSFWSPASPTLPQKTMKSASVSNLTPFEHKGRILLQEDLIFSSLMNEI